jgi:hypothetical protein
MLIHLRVDVIAGLIGRKLWVSRVDLVDVLPSRCTSPSAGQVIGHIPLPNMEAQFNALFSPDKNLKNTSSL